MSRFWSAVVHDLTPYVPGEQPKLPNLIKLNTNENPYGPGPRVLAAIAAEAAADADALRRYPDPSSDRLREAIAAHHAKYGIRSEQVFVGNGSDEVLAHAFMALLKHEKNGRVLPLLYPDITYSFYPVYCQLYGIPQRLLALDDAFAIRVDDYLASEDAGGIIFPNPNAPTGRLLPLPEIERLLAAKPDTVVVVDEAYIDFAGAEIPTAIALVNRYPNLVVIQTLSKSRSLAGLRVGLAVGQRDLIEALERVKDSFNSYPLDRLAIVGASAAFADVEHFEETRRAVIATREKLTTDLTRLGFSVVPSAANFVFARHPGHDAGKLSAALRERSIIVRHFKSGRIDQHLRITVGTDAECAALVAALTQLVA
jgi:histidinol-phosphate aminotransferase